MGLELAAIASIVVPCCAVAALGGLIGLALLGQRRRARRFAHAWQPFATQSGGHLKPGSAGRSTTVTWRANGQAFVLESYQRLGDSNDRTPYTRMRLLLNQPGPDFGLRSRGASEPGLVLETLARAGVTTDNPALDADYLVIRGDATRLGQVFDADLLTHLQSARSAQTLWLACAQRNSQPGLEIEERGDVTESARLQAWQAVLQKLAARWL